MRHSRPILLGLLFAASGLAAKPIDPTAEAIFKEKGLVRSGSTLVIEGETPVLAKMMDARLVSGEHAALVAKRNLSIQAVAHGDELDEMRANAQAQVDEQNANLQDLRNIKANLPPGKSYKLGRATTPMNNDITATREEALVRLKQIGAEQKATKALFLSEKDAKALDDKIVAKWDALKVLLVELRPLVDDVDQKYAELKTDGSVTQAMNDANKTAKPRLKLGPSDDFLKGARMLVNAEKLAFPKKGTRATTPKAKK